MPPSRADQLDASRSIEPVTDHPKGRKVREGNDVAAMPEMPSPEEIARKLLQATFKPVPVDIYGFSSLDYYRIASQAIFRCKRCGRCCTTGNPIKLKQSDIVRIARYLKMPINKAVKKFTVPYPQGDRPPRPKGDPVGKEEVLAFKKVQPCKFYDARAEGCKIYEVRPWSCRIFPFLGIYGSEERVKVYESCPGSVEAAETLTALINEVRADPSSSSPDEREIDQARRWLADLLDTLFLTQN